MSIAYSECNGKTQVYHEEKLRVRGGGTPLYSLFKMMLDVICSILAFEYWLTYRRYTSLATGHMYLGDLVMWLLAGLILFTEGLNHYLVYLGLNQRRKAPEAVL